MDTQSTKMRLVTRDRSYEIGAGRLENETAGPYNQGSGTTMLEQSAGRYESHID